MSRHHPTKTNAPQPVLTPFFHRSNIRFDNITLPAYSLAAMPLAPPFTKENAAQMALRSVEARKRNIKARLDAVEAELAKPSDQARDEQRQIRVKKQIDLIDDFLEAALVKGDWEQLDATSRVKARLWPLAQPTAGVLRPRGKDRSRMSLPVPVQATQAEPAITAKTCENANVSVPASNPVNPTVSDSGQPSQ